MIAPIVKRMATKADPTETPATAPADKLPPLEDVLVPLEPPPWVLMVLVIDAGGAVVGAVVV